VRDILSHAILESEFQKSLTLRLMANLAERVQLKLLWPAQLQEQYLA